MTTADQDALVEIAAALTAELRQMTHERDWLLAEADDDTRSRFMVARQRERERAAVTVDALGGTTVSGATATPTPTDTATGPPAASRAGAVGIPDAAVEAAARAEHLADWHDETEPTWEQLPAGEADSYRDHARILLTAAYPLLAAQALREAAGAIKSCRICGRPHQLRTLSGPDLPGTMRRSWADPDDGHDYRPARPGHIDEVAGWLDRRADELEAGRG